MGELVMWPFKKKKEHPTFKIDISNGSVISSDNKYILRKLSPISFNPKIPEYETIGFYDTHEDAVAAIEHYIDYPQYFDKTGKRVG
jgi:hypothetical protein